MARSWTAEVSGGEYRVEQTDDGLRMALTALGEPRGPVKRITESGSVVWLCEEKSERWISPQFPPAAVAEMRSVLESGEPGEQLELPL